MWQPMRRREASGGYRLLSPKRPNLQMIALAAMREPLSAYQASSTPVTLYSTYAEQAYCLRVSRVRELEKNSIVE